MDSVVWMPYGDIIFEDAERMRYMDRIVGFAKVRLIDAIERFRVHKGGDLPPHMEHVRAMPAGPAPNACSVHPMHACLKQGCFLSETLRSADLLIVAVTGLACAHKRTAPLPHQMLSVNMVKDAVRGVSVE